MDLVVQGKARLAVHWQLRLGSYLNPYKEHSVVWMQIQTVDPISSVEDHTTVLQKVTTLQFDNKFYLHYRN